MKHVLRVDSGGRIASINTDANGGVPSAIVTGGTVYVDSAGITAYRPS